MASPTATIEWWRVLPSFTEFYRVFNSKDGCQWTHQWISREGWTDDEIDSTRLDWMRNRLFYWPCHSFLALDRARLAFDSRSPFLIDCVAFVGHADSRAMFFFLFFVWFCFFVFSSTPPGSAVVLHFCFSFKKKWKPTKKTKQNER